MRVGYIRTAPGDLSGDAQRAALEAAGCERFFHDKGVPGGAVIKPQLDRALMAAGQGGVLVVTRLDRLARSMKFLIEDLERIGNLGTDLVSLHEAIDTTATGGRLFFHISAAFAQFERDIIRPHEKADPDAARLTGRPVGRPPAITHDLWPGIRQMLDSGMTIAAAARAAGVPRQSIYRRIEKEAGDAQITPPSKHRTTKMIMWLVVENNSKYVRGKGKTRQAIEMQLLPGFQARKLSKNGCEYELTFIHEDDDDLEEQIYGLSAEMSIEADFRNGFIEVEFQEVGTDRFWSG